MNLIILFLVLLNKYSFAYYQDGGYWSQEFKNQIYIYANNATEHFEPESSNFENFAKNDLFNCPTYISTYPRPTSVHRLRPSDIESIGAIGDSLTAANGAKAKTIIGVLLEDRGVSWSIGSEYKDINKLVSLPNILRQYNPSLYGASLATSGIGSELSGFNLAYPGSTSFEMLNQAKLLVERMASSDKINFEDGWKLVTFFVGGNDLCRSCNDGKYNPENFIRNVRNTLDYFQDHLPRTLVNMVLTLDVSGVEALDGELCRTIHDLLCSCGLSSSFRPRLKEITRQMQKGVEDLIFSGRYDYKDTFTVVVQPFMKLMVPPRKPDGNATDYSYFSPDCFHFSAKGHAAAAVELWKNMITPVGSKDEKWTNLNQPIPCPVI